MPYTLKKTPRFSIATPPPYTERICYATFNFRANSTTENHCYATETVIAAFREKQGNKRNYLARHCFRVVGKDAQGWKQEPLPSEDRLAKAMRHCSGPLHQSELERYCQASQCPPASNVVFKGEEEDCEVTPHSEAAAPRLGERAYATRRAASSSTVKSMAATQAFPGDNVDEGNSPEPPAKKAAKQPAKKPAAGGAGPGRMRCWGHEHAHLMRAGKAIGSLKVVHEGVIMQQHVWGWCPAARLVMYRE
eukprot:jgi/Tetstr1/426898/TSEL_017111.t1